MDENPQSILEDILNEISDMMGDLGRIKKVMDSKQQILEERLDYGQISQLYFDIETHQLSRSYAKLQNYARGLQTQRTIAIRKLREVEAS